MEKNDLYEKVNELSIDKANKSKILKWIKALPTNNFRVRPTHYRIGDVFMHPFFQHPIVLMKRIQNGFICGLLTSNPNCTVALSKCDSRLFYESYWAPTLTIINDSDLDTFRFYGLYDNDKEIQLIYESLSEFFHRVY